MGPLGQEMNGVSPAELSFLSECELARAKVSAQTSKANRHRIAMRGNAVNSLRVDKNLDRLYWCFISEVVDSSGSTWLAAGSYG